MSGKTVYTGALVGMRVRHACGCEYMSPLEPYHLMPGTVRFGPPEVETGCVACRLLLYPGEGEAEVVWRELVFENQDGEETIGLPG